MTQWILSIVGVAFLGVMLDILVPDGKTSDFIKSIFALVFMYVVISPIIALVKGDSDVDFDTSKYNYEKIDSTIYVNNQVLNNLDEHIIKYEHNTELKEYCIWLTM